MNDSDHESDRNQFFRDGKIGPTGHAKLWTMLPRDATAGRAGPALYALRVFLLTVSGGYPPVSLWKSSGYKEMEMMVRQNPANKGVTAKIFFPKGLWVKCEAPALAGAFFSTPLFKCTELSETKFHFWRIYFCVGR